MLYGDNPDRVPLAGLKLKAFAGEDTRPSEEYSTTSGACGCTAYMPGLQGAIGASFSTQMKMSRSYVAQEAPLKPPSMGLGKDARPPAVAADRDRWGNYRQRGTVARGLAQSYLNTVYTGAPRQEPLSAEDAAGMEAGEGAMFPKPKDCPRPTAPRRVVGHSGFRPGARDRFGESYHRTELACEAESADCHEAKFVADAEAEEEPRRRRGEVGAAIAVERTRAALSVSARQPAGRGGGDSGRPLSPQQAAGAALGGGGGGGRAGGSPVGSPCKQRRGSHRMQGGAARLAVSDPGPTDAAAVATSSFSRLTPRGVKEMSVTLGRGGRPRPSVSYDEVNVGGVAPIPMPQMGAQQL